MSRLASLIGTELGPYHVEAVLGVGGMATVFRGMDVGLRRPVAIKVLRPDLAANPEYVQRFRREAQLVASLRHPNIAQVYALGEHDGHIYMAQELLPGPPLDRRLHELALGGVLMGRAEALAVIGQLAAALSAAHSLGVIHRDVKPSNAIYNGAGQVMLTDFGIAHSPTEDDLLTTQPGAILGTPAYIAPEQALGRALTPAVDVYALGVLAYQILTGRVPFGADEAIVVLQRHLNERPRPPSELRPDLPPAVDAAILRALAKRPGERFPTATAFAESLVRAWPSGYTTPVLPEVAAPFGRATGALTLPVPAPTPTASKARVRWLGLVVALVVALVAGTLSLWPRGVAVAPADQGSPAEPPAAATGLVGAGAPSSGVILDPRPGNTPIEVVGAGGPGMVGRADTSSTGDGAAPAPPGVAVTPAGPAPAGADTAPAATAVGATTPVASGAPAQPAGSSTATTARAPADPSPGATGQTARAPTTTRAPSRGGPAPAPPPSRQPPTATTPPRAALPPIAVPPTPVPPTAVPPTPVPPTAVPPTPVPPTAVPPTPVPPTAVPPTPVPPTAVPPTATPEPPTLAPPTATPVPPTAVPPTATPEPPTLAPPTATPEPPAAAPPAPGEELRRLGELLDEGIAAGRAGPDGGQLAERYAAVVRAVEAGDQREARKDLRELGKQVSSGERRGTIEQPFADQLEAQIDAADAELRDR